MSHTDVMARSSMLIIDDDRYFVQQLTDFFNIKYTVLTSFTWKNAWNTLRSKDIDLIIINIASSEINGLELCSSIKTTQELSHISIIALTIKKSIEDKVSDLRSGADIYLEKPLSPVYLDAQISSIFQNKRKVKESLKRLSLNNTAQDIRAISNERFLSDLHFLIQANMTNPSLNIRFLAERLHVSRSMLYQKIKALSTLTPYEFIESARLKRAIMLMNEHHYYKIKEIASITGYSSPSQFTKVFKKKIGISPLNYIKDQMTKRKNDEQYNG